ncbi:MAG: hypothetical protein DRQ41_01265 [Gammaproteobacteria bacterium]|nr:MAG: hypothetical protein DRQ41_01265 [Gammaproteobacteria bacterium]
MRHLYYSFNDTIYQWSTGAAYLHLLYDLGPYRLITGVECEFPEIKEKQIALLDTGAELSVAGNEIYQVFSEKDIFLGTPVGTRKIHTRFGHFEGTLYRVDVSLKADWGEPLTIEGTFLFCEDWKGPTVLGFYGFLERIRFAIEPLKKNQADWWQPFMLT